MLGHYAMGERQSQLNLFFKATNELCSNYMTFFAMTISLFVVMNALGNIPLFLGLLGRYDPQQQRSIIIREMMIALAILLVFNFVGNELLQFLGISQPIMGIAGGILLFIIALGMIFPRQRVPDSRRQEPLIFPLAIPIVAGPGSITTVMIYAERTQSPFLISSAIVVAWIPTILLLVASSHIKRFLGEKGLIACERLGGMLISLIAMQMIATGTVKLVQSSFLTP